MAQKGTFKVGINNIISWGAAVVIIGLMAKLMHWPWGDWMIIVGLGTEAFLFFLLGFQKEDDAQEAPAKVVAAAPANVGAAASLDKMLQESEINREMIARLGDGLRSFGNQVQAISNVSDASLATNRFAETLNTATEGFNRLNVSFDKITKDLSNIGNTSLDTQHLQEQINTLNKNLAALNAVYANMLAAMNQPRV